MAKKILYFIRTHAHRRVFESLEHIDGVDQLILGPESKMVDGVSEGYDDFGIKDIKIHKNIAQAQQVINQFSPDILVQADFPDRIKVPSTCKRVFVAHGMVGNHVKDIFAAGSMKEWRDFDVYFGATATFQSWVHHITGKKHEVVLDALPQLDILHNPDYYNAHKDNILAHTPVKKPSAVILFCGFCCKKRQDFNAHNQDYFETIMELDKIAARNNWLILVKPRQTHKKIMKFIKCTNWAQQYKSRYEGIGQSKNLYFIPNDANIYRYFFADLIVCNGCSTIEIESCVANKPLVMVRTKSKASYDPFSTVKYGAAVEVKNLGALQSTITSLLDNNTLRAAQLKLLKDIGVSMDGLAHKRVQDRIINL